MLSYCSSPPNPSGALFDGQFYLAGGKEGTG